jgi:hypothetical protein
MNQEIEIKHLEVSDLSGYKSERRGFHVNEFSNLPNPSSRNMALDFSL